MSIKLQHWWSVKSINEHTIVTAELCFNDTSVSITPSSLQCGVLDSVIGDLCDTGSIDQERVLFRRLSCVQLLSTHWKHLSQYPVLMCIVFASWQGVIEFSLCLLFAKLVSYTFLFWLPLYITKAGTHIILIFSFVWISIIHTNKITISLMYAVLYLFMPVLHSHYVKIKIKGFQFFQTWLPVFFMDFTLCSQKQTGRWVKMFSCLRG